jgi:hypothetical protein
LKVKIASIGRLTGGLVIGAALTVGSTALAGGPALIINEYLYDPATGPTGDANGDGVTDVSQDEFVEFVNVSGGIVDLSGWYVTDSVAIRHTFPNGTSLGDGCAIVVFGGGSPAPFGFAGAIVQVASSTQLGLNNGGDTITLFDADAVAVVSVTYPDNLSVDVSYTLDPDLTGTAFVKHSQAVGSNGTLFSPGTFIDGTPFGDCASSGDDADGDGVPDDFDNCPDLANPDQADCNTNGIGDACEVLKDPQLDCNGNGIPDSCEPDCNQTGFPDDCDVLFGLSLDCNDNLIPDECETDCNGNFVPDDCDIAGGISLDQNGNGIPDECESGLNLVINEILADPPAGSDANNDGVASTTADEFIEIVNAGAGPADISGVVIYDAATGGTIRHVFPSGTIIPANCGIVVFSGGNPIGQFGGCQVQTASTGALSFNNENETITLRDSNGLLVDEYSYGTEGGQNSSLTRSPDITGSFVVHSTVAPKNAAYSPGTRLNGAVFGGCPPVLADADSDGIPDVDDNCPNTPNPLQADCDRDGVGDICDTEPDGNGNGIPDVCEVVVPGNLKLSEIRIDETGTDNNEYFEIKGPPGLSLDGLTLFVIGDGAAAAGSGVIESITPLQGLAIPSDGYFLAGESTFTLAPSSQVDLTTPTLNFENGDHVTFVLASNFSGFNGQDLDTNNDGALDITPWGAVVDAVGFIVEPNPPAANDWAYGASLGGSDVGPDVQPSGSFIPGQIYRCETAGLWTIGKFNPFDPSGGTDTPGSANLACTGVPCPGDRTGNGIVDVDDLLAVINTWGSNNPIGDATGNGIVDVDDLLIVINGWGACD